MSGRETLNVKTASHTTTRRVSSDGTRWWQGMATKGMCDSRSWYVTRYNRVDPCRERDARTDRIPPLDPFPLSPPTRHPTFDAQVDVSDLIYSPFTPLGSTFTASDLRTSQNVSPSTSKRRRMALQQCLMPYRGIWSPRCMSVSAFHSYARGRQLTIHAGRSRRALREVWSPDKHRHPTRHCHRSQRTKPPK